MVLKTKKGIRLCKKIQILLEGFFWPIDNGRLMGDPNYLRPEKNLKDLSINNILNYKKHSRVMYTKLVFYKFFSEGIC